MDNNIILWTSEALDHYAAHLLRDDEMQAIFSDPETMLPSLPMLFNMSQTDWKTRRNLHRSDFLAGNSAFMDLVSRETGEVVGSSGFRSINKEKEAEWGIVITKKWQRKGLCKEAHDASMAWARKNGIVKVTAATLPTNTAMLTFFEREGWTKTGDSHTDSEARTWIEFVYSKY